MIAYSEFSNRGDVGEKRLGQHPKGVQLGDTFDLKAELAVSGIHTLIPSGIDYMCDCLSLSPLKITYRANEGCNAIVLSGCYRRDFDEGSSFTYSGAGGVTQGSQVHLTTAFIVI